MSQRSVSPLKLTVPTLYPAAGPSSSGLLTSKFKFPFSPALTPTPNPRPRPNEAPAWIISILQLVPLYMLNKWLNTLPFSPSLVPFIFAALLSSTSGVWFSRQPSKGRPLPTRQWGFLVVHGGILALSMTLRFEGMRFVGPLATVCGEYAGAVVGKWLLNSVMKGSGRSGVRGLISVVIGVFLLSQGWAIGSCFPLSIKGASQISFLPSSMRNYRLASLGSESTWLELQKCVKIVHILAPISAGLLSSLYKFSMGRTSLKSVPKKRLQTLSVTMATILVAPLALLQWDSQVMLNSSALLPLCAMIGLGFLQVLYGDSYWEEKLMISPLSSKHYIITACCICLMELWYGMDLSLVGFVFCTFLLGVGVRELTYSDREISWDSIADHESAHIFATLVKNPFQHLLRDRKSRKIALFLVINSSFMVVEFIFGFLSNSLGLISDACHMLFDCAALAIGLYASYISRLPANEKFNYGYGRFEVLSGYANAVFLILVASLIVLESLERILDPPEISTESLLFVSVGGFLVNMVGLVFFHDEHHHAHGSDSCSHSQSNKQSSKCDHSHAEKTCVDKYECKSGHTHSHEHKHAGHLHEQHEHDHDHDHHSLDCHSHGSKHDADNNHERHISHEFAFYNPINRQLHKSNSFLEESLHSSPDRCKSDLYVHSKNSNAGHAHEHYNGHEFAFHSPGSEQLHESSHSLSEQAHGHVHKITTDDHHHNEQKHVCSHPYESTGHCSHTHANEHGDHNCNGEVVNLHAFSHSPGGFHDFEQQNLVLSPRSPFHGKPIFQDRNAEHNFVNRTTGKSEQRNGSEAVDSINGPKCQHRHDCLQKDHAVMDGDARALCSHPYSASDHQGNECHSPQGFQEQVLVQDLQVSNGSVHAHQEHSDYSFASKTESEIGHHDFGFSYQNGTALGDLNLASHTDCLHHNHDHHDDGHSDNHDHHHHMDHNMRGIFLHVLADTLGSVGVVISTILIKYQGWLWTDPACSIFISLLIISTVIPLVRNSAEILLQRSPRTHEATLKRIAKKLAKMQGISGFNRLHVWSFTNKEVVGSVQIHTNLGVDKGIMRKEVLRLFEDAGITDITIQIEDM